MRLGRTFESAGRFLQASLLDRPQLLGIGWAITHRCNSRCPFCDRHSGPEGLPTETALDIIDQLAELGCRRVHFTGGEPLMRKDLEELLRHVRRRRMTSSVNTNGALLMERPGVVDASDSFLVSIDGPEAIHDRYRGAGSHARLLGGLAALVRANKPRVLSVTLFRDNLEQLPYFLGLATRFDTRVVLQPGATHVLGSTAANPEAPEVERYRAVLRELLADKDAQRWLWNSPAGLRELLGFPEQHGLRTHAGRITARLEVDGCMYPCSRSVNDPQAQPAPNVLDVGVGEAFRRMPRIDCSGHVCQCAHNIEKNLLFALRPSAWWNLATRRFGELARMAG
ncbi:MAG: radical SAM protein [Myxococcales bacterium]|nr:radical SAM protein [Myxococcales bacterium]